MGSQHNDSEHYELTPDLITQLTESNAPRSVWIRSGTHTPRSASKLSSKLLDTFSQKVDQLPQTGQWERNIRKLQQLVRDGDIRLALRQDLDLMKLERALGESWAGAPVNPEDAYLKVLIEVFKQPTSMPSRQVDDDSRVARQLADFQTDAFNFGQHTIERYGGVLLADDVGLGKTYVSLALVEWLARELDEHAVALVPPKVSDYWEKLAYEFRLSLPVISQGKLQDLNKHQDRAVLVIDEAHRFRNHCTQRYEDVIKWLRTGRASKKVILLSATPYNTGVCDIEQLLRLFPSSKEYESLPYKVCAEGTRYDQEQSEDVAMKDVLEHVAIRRTRAAIRRDYSGSMLPQRSEDGELHHVPLRFPDRVMGPKQCLRYNIEEAYGTGLYDDLLHMVGRLSYANYGPADYLRPEHAEKPELQGIAASGHRMRGQFKVLLLKRLESSVDAAKRSMRALENKLATALEAMKRSVVTATYRYDTEPENEANACKSDVREFPLALFDADRLRTAISEDFDAVRQLRTKLDRIGPAQDLKLNRLHRYLATRRPSDHRTVIFTQFSDTAKYLYDQLDQAHGRTGLVTGSTSNPQAWVDRFAPRANHAEDLVDQHDQLDLLITTDVLSEGVNLQDADTLVNYDIHWNPVQLIQRAGRIDRIGSQHQEIHIASFLPERGLEKELGLEEVVRARIREFQDVLGLDSSPLPTETPLHQQDMLASYNGQALDSGKTYSSVDEQTLAEHHARLIQRRREAPARYQELRGLRPGRRAYSASAASTVAVAKVGSSISFWVADQDGTPKKLGSDTHGLKVLYEHARAGNAPDAEDLAALKGPEVGAFVQRVRSALKTSAYANAPEIVAVFIGRAS